MNKGVMFLGPIIIFVGLVLMFTSLGVSSYSPSEPLGTFRRFSSLLPKAIQLLAFGLLLSILTTAARRKMSLSSLSYPLLFLILLDLDHLPSFFEIDQPIRPAHSLIFLLISMVAIVAFEKVKVASSVTLASSFLGHLGSDSPLFPLFAPISTQLFSFDGVVSMVLIFISVLLALVTGLIYRRTDIQTISG